MSKNLLWITDGAGDIGTTSDQRPNNAYIKALIQVGGQILISPTNIQFSNQSSTPSNPASGKSKLYFKSDGNLYKLNSSGTETPVEASGTSIALDGSTTPTANISWAGNKITNLGDPVSSSDAATKDYVDSIAGSFGDVFGPALSSDNALSRYDGTTGKLLQNSPISLSDGGSLLWATDGVGDIGASAASRPNISYIKSRVILEQSATPANPPANNFALYFKSDGNLYKLNSSGTETVFAAGGGVTFPLLGDNGSPSNPTYSYTNSTNAGWYRHDANYIAVSHGGAVRMYVGDTYVQPVTTYFAVGPLVGESFAALEGAPTLTFNTNFAAGLYQYNVTSNAYMGATLGGRVWEAGTNYGNGNTLGLAFFRQLIFPTHTGIASSGGYAGSTYVSDITVGSNGYGNGAGQLIMRGTGGSSPGTSSPLATNIVWENAGSGTVGRSDGASPTAVYALNNVVIGKPLGVGILGNSPGIGLGGSLGFIGNFGRTITDVGIITFRQDEQTVVVDCLPTGATGGDGIFYFRTGSTYNDNGPGVTDDTITGGTPVSPPANIRPGSTIVGEGYAGTITSITYLTGDPQDEFAEGPNPGMTCSPPYPALQKGFAGRAFKVIQQYPSVGTNINRPYNVYSKAIDIGGSTCIYAEDSTLSGGDGSTAVNAQKGGDVTVKGGKGYEYQGSSLGIASGGDVYINGGQGDIGGLIEIIGGQGGYYVPENGPLANIPGEDGSVLIKTWDYTGAYAATNGGHVYSGNLTLSSGGTETVAGLSRAGDISITGGDSATQGIANQHYDARGGAITLKAGDAQSTNNTFTQNDVIGGDILIEAGSATAGTAAGALNAAGKVTIKSGNASASTPILVGDIELIAGSGPTENGHILLKAATNNIALYSASNIPTTDATVTTVFSKTLADNTVYYFTAKVTARQTNAVNRAVYERKVCVYREAAGVATIQGTVSDIFTQESNTLWDCTWDVTGNIVRLRVTGDVASDVSWNCSIEEQKT